MATVYFYEKPGCSGNARQKALLTAAGHRVEARDLLATQWSKARLHSFLTRLPVAQWFNPNAPEVKAGRINPVAFSADAALTRLLAEPLLIRRPLLECAGERRAGFDAAEIHAWIGLGDAWPAGNLEACRHDDGGRCDG